MSFNLELWSYALLSTFAVSILPVIFLFLVPLIASKKDKDVSVSGKWLSWFLGFSAGALLGDAFLHLISGHGHDHDNSEDHGKGNGMAILTGILVFFGIDLFSVSSCNSHSHHSHSHKKSDDHRSHKKSEDHQINGFLSLLADSIHNFTDGLTIAAAWASSSSAGISTTIAIFVHEIPHELGDYAILIKAGYTHSQVLKCQFITAAAAFAGTLIGLSLQNSKNSILLAAFKLILPFSAGGFIYLALASIIPEILRSKKSVTLCRKETILQFGVFIMGILLMTILE